MAYHALTENTLFDYLRGRPALTKHLPHGAALFVREVGDGNLNLVFVVSGQAAPGAGPGSRSDQAGPGPQPAQAVIVKQALNYLRVAGESWPLTRERMRFESQAMLLYNELCPGLVPRIYDYDAEMSLMVMEFLGSHEIMRKALVARRRFPKFVDHISTFLVNSLSRRRCRPASSIPNSTSCRRTSSTPTRTSPPPRTSGTPGEKQRVSDLENRQEPRVLQLRMPGRFSCFKSRRRSETCRSLDSRNRTVGYGLSRGSSTNFTMKSLGQKMARLGVSRRKKTLVNENLVALSR